MRRREVTDAAEGLGCTSCYGDDPERSWAYCRQGGLIVDQYVTDESHFIVQLRRCAECSQRFVWIVTELVDWHGGDDAQYRTVVPVTADEARKVAERGADVDFAFLEALGDTRRYLQADRPTGDREERVRWSAGRLLIPRGY